MRLAPNRGTPADGLYRVSGTHDVERLIDEERVLSICADLCNGTKHSWLDPRRRPRTGDATTAFTGQSVAVRPATAGSREPPRPALHDWRVESEGQQYRAVELADHVVKAWQGWLREQSLLS